MFDYTVDEVGNIVQLDSGRILGTNSEDIVTNEQGGKESKLDYRFDLVDPKAMFRMAHILHEGEAKYGYNNWRKLDTRDNVNRAITHLYAYLFDIEYGLTEGDKDDHLAHALCRIMFAIGCEK